MRFSVTALVLTASFMSQLGLAFADEGLQMSGSSYNSIPIKCLDTKITAIRHPQWLANLGTWNMLGGMYGSETFGNQVMVSIHTDPVDNRVWMQNKVGDKVQICLLSIPARTDRCNPDIDTRGRIYYVYDYRLKGAFIETTGEHYCGGA